MIGSASQPNMFSRHGQEAWRSDGASELDTVLMHGVPLKPPGYSPNAFVTP